MREQLQHAATTLCLLAMGCTGTHTLSNDAAGDAGVLVDAPSEDTRRVDANAPDANAELATTARYWEDGRPVEDAFVIFGNAEGDIVEVVRTGADGRASSLLFEAGIVTAVDARGYPRFFEVRTGILRGDALVFGRNADPGTFVRNSLVITEPFPGAVRYRIGHREVAIGEPLSIDDYYPSGVGGFTAEALDASGRVIAQSWLERRLTEGTPTFVGWGESVTIPVSVSGAPSADVTLYVDVANTYRREVGEYVESAIATMIVYGTGWDDPAVMGFEEARTTQGPADDTFGHNVRVGPDGEVFTCTRTSNFMAADRDEDGLPDTNDPCSDDRDDAC